MQLISVLFATVMLASDNQNPSSTASDPCFSAAKPDSSVASSACAADPRSSAARLSTSSSSGYPSTTFASASDPAQSNSASSSSLPGTSAIPNVPLEKMREEIERMKAYTEYQQLEIAILEGEKGKMARRQENAEAEKECCKTEMEAREARFQNIMDAELEKTLADRVQQFEQALTPVIQNEIDQKRQEIQTISADKEFNERMARQAYHEIALIKKGLSEEEYAELQKIVKEMCCSKSETRAPYCQLVSHAQVDNTCNFVKTNFDAQGWFSSDKKRQVELAAEQMKSEDDETVIKTLLDYSSHYDKDKQYDWNTNGETVAHYRYWQLYYNAKYVNGKALLCIKSGGIYACAHAKHGLKGDKLEKALKLYIAESEAQAHEEQVKASTELKDAKLDELEDFTKLRSKRLRPRVQDI